MTEENHEELTAEETKVLKGIADSFSTASKVSKFIKTVALYITIVLGAFLAYKGLIPK